MRNKFVGRVASAIRENMTGNSVPGLRAAQSGLPVGTALMAVLTVVSTAQAADPEHGKVVFQTCVACHTDKPDAIGPSLRGVYGRKSGSLADFRYSNAMLHANLTWDDVNLRDYLKDPQAKVKGNRMPFGGLSSDQDIDDVVAYLKTYK
jgi:cytochrome c